jgi:hypothetical protein
MRARIFLLLAVIATPAMAFRARPVSDFRFEDRIPITYRGVAAASDGTDYLVLLQHEDNGNIYAQLISQGVPYGPAVLIGHLFVLPNGQTEGFGSVIWTGSTYLVAWADEQSTYVRAVSRRGVLLSAPRTVIGLGGGAPRIASNGRTILVFNQFWASLVSLNGDPMGSMFKMGYQLNRFSADEYYALTGTGTGFALAVFGKQTRVLQFDDGGNSRSTGGTLVESPFDPSDTFASYGGRLTSDGTYVEVIYNSRVDSASYALKSALIDSTHEQLVQPPRTLLPSAANIGSVLWNGSEYVAVYSAFPTQSDVGGAMLQRISRAGEPLNDPLPLSTPGALSTNVATSNGREYLVVVGDSFVRLPMGSRNPPAPAPLSRLLDSQEALAIARGRQDFLSVWRESDRNGTTIRASRIDAKGRYLDGTGIVIATFPDPTHSPPTISVDSDGQNWLVIWTYNNHASGCRVSAQGVVLDSKPIAISAAAANAVVRWGGTSWLIVVVTNWKLTNTTVTSDGLVGPSKVFDEVSADPFSHYVQYVNPALAFDGQQFVVAVGLGEIVTHSSETIAIVTERLALNGDPIGGSKFASQPQFLDNFTLSLATNGSQDLIAFEYGTAEPPPVYATRFGIQGLLLNRGFAPATITIVPTAITRDAAQPIGWDTAWNGNEFIVAHSTQDGAVQVTHLSKLGVAGETVTLPRDSGEITHGVVFPPSSPASLTDLPLGLLTTHDAYEGISRAQLAFAGDVADSQFPHPLPVVPVIGKAIGDPSGVTVIWQPQDRVLGFEIALLETDGTERVIGIAAGSASSTHISYAGLTGTTLRLRAWNAAGLSAPSSEVPLLTPRVRAAAK